jgi:para-aminobenzoate synthetase component 1
MRNAHIYNITDIVSFKKKLLYWLSRFDTFSYLDNNEYTDYRYSNYELLAAAGTQHVIKCNSGSAFFMLEKFVSEHCNWAFGYFGYDLKNEIENLYSAHSDHLCFPDLFFFVPEYLIYIKAGTRSVTIESSAADEIFNEIISQDISQKTIAIASVNKPPAIQMRFAKSEYLNTVEKIRQLIADGSFYELNLCMEFYATNAIINPLHVFEKLNKLNRAPFSVFFRNNDHYLICSSPERFLMKQGNKIISQPMKGTIKKGNSRQDDEQLKIQLLHDEKERAENVMIVDLVRNDLARSCTPGSVKVEELFGIYTFSQVHQMVSTVSGTLRNNITPVQAIKNAFPMGSMTGAPKVIVMEHIEKFEQSKRGLFSGAFGYFTPDHDFDFNVVIRSILYNSHTQYLSFQTGSAITFDSDAAKEYQECLVKAQAMLSATDV